MTQAVRRSAYHSSNRMPRVKRQKVLKKYDTARCSVVEVADLSSDTDDAMSEAEDESEPRSVSLRTV
jgi:hypothetical protein